MKGILLALVMGLILGGTGTAVAMSQSWTHQTRLYRCSGNSKIAACDLRGTPYSVMVTPVGKGYRPAVAVLFRGTSIFLCENDHSIPRDDCSDQRPR